MSDTGYPVFYSQQSAKVDTFRIDGSEVSTSDSTDGLDGRGKAFCVIKKAANVQTITLNRPLPTGQVPYVCLTPLTANAGYNLTLSNTQIIIEGVERDDNTAPLNDCDWVVTVTHYNTTNYVL